MKQIKLTFLFTMLMSMVGIHTFAIEIVNRSGVNYSINRTTKKAYVVSVTNIGWGVSILSCFKDNGQEFIVEGIGPEAFKDHVELHEVSIPGTVKTINEKAFMNCTSLSKVSIPNEGSLQHISQSAFKNCTSLTSISIPSNVTQINGSAFFGCFNLRDIFCYAEQAPTIYPTIFDDVSLEYVTLHVPSYKINHYKYATIWENFNFKEIVTITGDEEGDDYSNVELDGIAYKLDHRNNLAEVTWVPNESEIEIPSYVYYNGNRFSVLKIGHYAFTGCSSLTSVVIPNSVRHIGLKAFENCSKLSSVTIPNSVLFIKGNTFYNCSSLTAVTIGSGVEFIEDNAFKKCDALVSVTINSNALVSGSYYSKYNYIHDFDYIFGNQVKEYILGEGVTSIGESSIGESPFYGCSGITSVTIPNSMTSIDEGNFEGCSGLTSVTLNSNSIVSKSYTSSSNLGSIFGIQVNEYVIGNEVSSIGKNAFYGCTGLTSVTIPNSVTSIGDSAFNGCSDLKKVIVRDIATWLDIFFYTENANPLYYAHHLYSDENTEITDLVIPDGVTSIGSKSFYNCSGLTSVTIPSSVTSIGNYAFRGCSGLTSVTIPSSVTSIGVGAFSGCSGLTSLTIPQSVISIGDNAFSSCTGLISVTIPNSVTNIGYGAFYNCSGLNKVIVNDIAAWCKISFDSGFVGNDGDANPLNSAHHLYSDENTEITDLVIPEGVTSIGSCAFFGCSGLTSVTIPNSVTNIGGYAFNDCSDLTSVYVDWGTPMNISANVFSNRKNANLYVPAGCKDVYATADYWGEFKEIFEKAGSHYVGDIITATTIEGIEMKFKVISPTEVEVCSETIDQDVTGSVTIPEMVEEEYHVTSIGLGAFYNGHMDNVTAINIPNSVTSIGDYAFAFCGSMTSAFSISIPNNVTTIGNHAFFMCQSLQSVKLGSQLTSIGIAAFTGCYNIQEIVCKAKTPPTCEDGALSSINKSDCKLYVPTGSLSAYQAADQWKEFKEIFEIETAVSGDANGDGTVDAADVVAIVNYILNKPGENFNEKAADVNGDGVVNVADVLAVVNVIGK